MPPLRFHKNPEEARPTPAPTTDAEEDQFESELGFCIDQLQKVLDDSSVNQKKSKKYLLDVFGCFDTGFLFAAKDDSSIKFAKDKPGFSFDIPC